MLRLAVQAASARARRHSTEIEREKALEHLGRTLARAHSLAELFLLCSTRRKALKGGNAQRPLLFSVCARGQWILSHHLRHQRGTELAAR
jgi:hypothetical protein